MKFDKAALRNPNRESHEWTPRREAAARRAVQRELDEVPLFPELARIKTVDDRKKQIERNSADLCKRIRNHEAQAWKQGRRILRSLPAITQTGVAKLWAQWNGPRTGSYFVGFIKRCIAVSPWTQLRQFHQLKRQGEIWRRERGWA